MADKKTTNYHSEFLTAYERTKNLGLNCPPFTSEVAGKLCSPTFLREFPYLIRDNTNVSSPEDLAHQCLYVNLLIKDIISKRLNCEVYYTIGWIDCDDGDPMYKFDEEYISTALAHYGSTRGALKVHAWLTLPTMEVIDPTLATSIALVQNKPNGLGGVIAGKADDLQGFSYRPMLIGMDFPVRTGGMVVA
ncbi:hypothetical protein [Acetobacter cerevisiae]|uniref:Uncharacterized protein n=1 Tax=Acetobacter cerevisiae TaxID=178900 RepID=A0A149UR21_9PROT|nr:hypothetical protein [Acetobacter cerevisiae]KXV70459.1 hypothetical protein AD952_12830 [Acetobacter cerevisiae]MCP1271976.1 hypothetical protein [Acetobacter cerevisiae]MCP1279931.1 hypothetical protein [Acetobacter cerevisiae]